MKTGLVMVLLGLGGCSSVQVGRLRHDDSGRVSAMMSRAEPEQSEWAGLVQSDYKGLTIAARRVH